MGYSGRYHAASLAAVFVALAVGILIGIGLADDVVSSASEEVRDSLRSDLDDAGSEIDTLEADLDREREFTDAAAPALVAGRLARDRVALISLGGLPDDETPREVQEAVEAGGAELASVASLDLPADLPAVTAAAGGRFDGPGRDSARAVQLGEAVGRQMIGGGPLVERVSSELFSSFNGRLAGVNRVVLVSRPPADLEGQVSGEEREFASALLRGIDGRAAGAAGVERTSTEPTTLGAFSSVGIPTVDNVDTEPGQVALVFALLGAEGDFGVKEGATSLLPDLLAPQPGP